MRTSQLAKETLTNMVKGLLRAIELHGEKLATDGILEIDFTLVNPDTCWAGMEDMKVVKIDFANDLIITTIYGGKQWEVDYSEFGPLELVELLSHLEQMAEDRHINIEVN
jgi:hypothetical protein